jgi:hypothetical protein
MVLRLQRVTPIVSSQLSRPDARGVTIRNTARQTRENRTITINFQSEAAYFQLLGDRKAFLECVLAFVLSLGFQLKHKATCRGGGGLPLHRLPITPSLNVRLHVPERFDHDRLEGTDDSVHYG